MSLTQDQTYARPYAEAAYRYAKQQAAVPAWKDFLLTVADFFSQSALQEYLNNPFIDQTQLIDVIAKAAGSSLNAAQINFLLLLAENNRLVFLPAIATYFEKIQDQDEGILRATVTSAYELDNTTLSHLQQKLAAKFQKQIVMKTKTNTDLIGGLKIQIGDHVLGASVKDMLAQLIQSLSRNTLRDAH